MAHERDEALDTALAAADRALQKQAIAPVLLKVGPLVSYTDYVLILGGRSMRQVRAIAEALLQGMKDAGFRPLGVEGLGEGRWVVVDYTDVVVHIFLEELRDYYDLESLWVDATRVPIDLPVESAADAG